MWSPTHINITVHKARNLLCKGKAGTNDCYTTMHLGKDKYHTSIKEKSKDPEWQEECDFPMSEQKSILKIGVYHRNLLGLDEFLGQVAIPLDQFQIYDRPRNRWYTLKGKPGSTKPEKNRGEIELTVAFMVHSLSGSYIGLNKSEKATKSLSIKSLAHSVGDKLTMKWPSKSNLSMKSGSRSDVSSGAFSAQSMLDLRFLSRGLSPEGAKVPKCRGYAINSRINASPSKDYFAQGILSASQKSLTDSNSLTEPTKTLGSSVAGKDQMSSLASLVELSEDTPDSVFPPDDSIASSTVPSPEFISSSDKLTGDGGTRPDGEESLMEGNAEETRARKMTSESPKTGSAEKFNDKFRRFKDGSGVKCFTLGHPGRSTPQVSAYEMHEMEEYKRTRRELQKTRNILSNEMIDRFSAYEKEDLIKLVVDQSNEISKKDSYIRDLEDYIDNLLVKVIETQPKLLQNPYEQPTAMHPSSAKKLSTASSPPLIPLSSTMPPGIYVTSTTGESAQSKNAVTMVTAPNNKKLSATKNNRRQLIIASPFKKLQALIK